VKKRTRKGSDIYFNIPYDPDFEVMLLAYLAYSVCLGLKPRLVLEEVSATPRLQRIWKTMLACRVSIHDLSRIDVPRFNMPVELGMAIALQNLKGVEEHRCVAFVGNRRKFEKAASNLRGLDPLCHRGRPVVVLNEMFNAVIRKDRQPSKKDVLVVFKQLQNAAPEIQRRFGQETAFAPVVWKYLVLTAAGLAQKVRLRVAAGPPRIVR
jgi:hypothetical protein